MKRVCVTLIMISRCLMRHLCLKNEWMGEKMSVVTVSTDAAKAESESGGTHDHQVAQKPQ